MCLYKTLLKKNTVKGYCRNICFNEGFVCNRNVNNCITLLSEDSTNSIKVETRTKQSCKILIDILYCRYLLLTLKF